MIEKVKVDVERLRQEALVDEIHESLSDALVNALVSEEFQRALFKAIYGAINLVELKKSERGITDDTV